MSKSVEKEIEALKRDVVALKAHAFPSLTDHDIVRPEPKPAKPKRSRRRIISRGVEP
jgi:hypothetical protein